MSLANLKIGVRLALGFGSILLLVLVLSGVALNGMNGLAGLTDKLYKHPFVVSTAVLRIDRNITTIRLHMRSALIATDSAERSKSYKAIEQLDVEADQDFKIIMERFLGDKNRVELFQKTYACRQA